MSGRKNHGMDPDLAYRAGLELFAAWPCPDRSTERGWPTPDWRRRYMRLRRHLVCGPQPVAKEATAELFDLQVMMRDRISEQPPDVASQWEESFAALGRASDLIQAGSAARTNAPGR